MNFNNYTQKSIEAVQSAQQLAVQNSHQQMEQVHLLLALLRQEGGLTPQLLKKMDVTVESLEAAAEAELRKIPGGIVAALGVVFPSFVVITIIAAFLANFSDYPAVQHALAGINAVVVALILSSVLKLGKTTLKNAPSLCVFLGVLVLGELAGLLDLPADSAAGSVLNLLANPAVLVVLAGIAGWLLFRTKNRGKEDAA